MWPFKRRPKSVVYIVPRARSKAAKQFAERQAALHEQLRREIAMHRGVGAQ